VIIYVLCGIVLIHTFWSIGKDHDTIFWKPKRDFRQTQEDAVIFKFHPERNHL